MRYMRYFIDLNHPKLMRRSVKRTGAVWLMVGIWGLISALWSVQDNLILPYLFNHHTIALLIFSAFSLTRGIIALKVPHKYWYWFRACTYSTDVHFPRFLFLTLCCIAWFVCTRFTGFSMPVWLIVWGALAWLWWIFPFLSWLPDETPHQKRRRLEMLHDELIERPLVNPASGLPMYSDSIFDIKGNTYGSSGSS